MAWSEVELPAFTYPFAYSLSYVVLGSNVSLDISTHIRSGSFCAGMKRCVVVTTTFESAL